MSTRVFLTSLFCHFRLLCKLAAAESYFSSFIWLGWLRTQWDNTRKRGKATKDIIWSLLRRHQKICCRLRKKTDRHRSIRRRSLLLLFRERETDKREKQENMESKGRQEKYLDLCTHRNFCFYILYPLILYYWQFQLPVIPPHVFQALFFSSYLSGSTFTCVFMRRVPIYSLVYLYFSSSSLSAVAPKLYFPN